MRTFVIFNPAARGEKARRLLGRLSGLGDCTVEPTTAAGAGRALATEAVAGGFDTIVAAGGDGTVNEVLNGIGDARDGFSKARLAVLPLGSVNVFARELNLPRRLDHAWEVVRRGRERRIDLPRVEFLRDGCAVRRHFAQLAGAGLDARTVELVSWTLKKAIGPPAYVAACLGAMTETLPAVEAVGGANRASGPLIVIGNGRFYGGPFEVFPAADLCDGLLDATAFPTVSWAALIHCGASLLSARRLPRGRVRRFRASSIVLTGPPGTPFEVDGELCGRLPASFSVEPAALRVVVP